MVQPKKWSPENDLQLFELFRKGPRRGGISPKDLNPKVVRKEIERHFPGRTYESFAPTFRKKARAWLLEQELSGARSEKQSKLISALLMWCCVPCFSHSHLLLERTISTEAAAAKKNSESLGDKDSSEDKEDYVDEEEESDEGSLEGFVDESSEEEKEEEKEEEMPPRKKTSSKSPQRPPAKKKAAPAAVDDVTAGMQGMGVSEKKSFSMDFQCPHMLFVHTVDQREHVEIQFYVPTLPNIHFRPRRHPEIADKLLLGIVVPPFFPDKERLNVVFGQEADFNQSTHMNTAYKKLADDVAEVFDDGSPEITYIGKPQEVDLPFSCEEEVDWEVQFYPNDVDELTDALGGLQFFAVMTVDLVNIAKPKNRAVGGIRVVGGAAGGQQQQQPMQQNWTNNDENIRRQAEAILRRTEQYTQKYVLESS